MFSRIFIRSVALKGCTWMLAAAAMGSIASGSLTLACGGGQSEPVIATLKPGNMPSGGDWTGVFYNPVFGHLHLIKSGNSASGKWRTATGDKWGQLNGTVTGDVFRYEWIEHTIGLVGPGATAKGKGYFRYLIPKGDNVEHEIHGEWGLGPSDAGNPWNAIKQRNQTPRPDSVAPDETQQPAGDQWQ